MLRKTFAKLCHSMGVSRGGREPAYAFTHTRLRDSNPGQRSGSPKAGFGPGPFGFSPLAGRVVCARSSNSGITHLRS